jgi:anti-repressor protein
MNQLIAISNQEISGEGKQTVNARDLHSFLGVKKDFSDWIKKQISRARLTEGRDFIVLPQKGENLSGGRPSMDYHFTLEAGKHIAMLSNTDKGFDVRDYFIECEKVAQSSPSSYQLPSDFKSALLQLVYQVEENEKLQHTITEQTPKVESFDRIALADGLMNITNTAKTLQKRPIDVIGFMSANLWIYKRAGGRNWVAYQNKLQQGLLSHKVTTVQTSDGREKIVEQVLVTPKGLTKLAAIFSEARA